MLRRDMPPISTLSSRTTTSGRQIIDVEGRNHLGEHGTGNA